MTRTWNKARRLERHLGPGEPQESLYFGGDYYLWRLGSPEVVLQTNRDLDEELAEPDHPDFPLLVRVSGDGDLTDREAVSSGLDLVALRPPSVG